MKEELTVYVEPESMGEESSQTEMKLFATLQGYTSTPEQIDKPADPKLVKEIQRAKEVANEVPAAGIRKPQRAFRKIEIEHQQQGIRPHRKHFFRCRNGRVQRRNRQKRKGRSPACR